MTSGFGLQNICLTSETGLNALIMNDQGGAPDRLNLLSERKFIVKRSHFFYCFSSHAFNACRRA